MLCMTFMMMNMMKYSSMLIPMLAIITMTTMMMFSENVFYTLNMYMYMDKMSFMMIMLTLMSTILIMISSNSFTQISLMMMLILLFLMMTFSTSNLFIFYIMFEMVLIPTLFLITKSGSQPERMQAGMYLILYTISASLPLLASILSMKIFQNMIFYSTFCLKMSYSLPLILAFLVKMPMFIFHLWLPKAHVEAPLEGSMILAAVLLKLGGYGIIRITPLIPKLNTMSPWIISISLIGAMSTSMNCIWQKDLKSLIAYSSVAHMGLILASLFTFSFVGMKGAILMMVAHGLSSSALFLLVNIIYMKYHTRNIISFKGLTKSFPNLMFWWFIFVAINISAPPSINLLSEIMMLMSMMSWQPLIMGTLFMISSLMTTIFSINLFTNISHNKPEMKFMETSSSKMFLSLFMHFIPLILISMKIEIM